MTNATDLTNGIFTIKANSRSTSPALASINPNPTLLELNVTAKDGDVMQCYARCGEATTWIRIKGGEVTAWLIAACAALLLGEEALQHVTHVSGLRGRPLPAALRGATGPSQPVHAWNNQATYDIEVSKGLTRVKAALDGSKWRIAPPSNNA